MKGREMKGREMKGREMKGREMKGREMKRKRRTISQDKHKEKGKERMTGPSRKMVALGACLAILIAVAVCKTPDSQGECHSAPQQSQARD